jgi:hypothetical protein
MKNTFTLLLIHLWFLSFGQTFTKIPLNYQLIPRDLTTNMGNVKIEGTVSQSKDYASLRVDLFRNGVLVNSEENILTYNALQASFAFNSLFIKAELANYSINIYGKYLNSNNTAFIKTVTNIVAGDAYIVQGQSNAEANIRNGSANSNKSDFIRVYASGNDNASNLISNNAWYIAQGDGDRNSNGNTGQWGLKLARILVDDLQIPIAIFNGGHGGAPISFFQADANYKNSQASNYGRMFYRINKTGLQNNVRGVLWSQGEANAGGNYIAINDYKNAFKTLENSWLADYPSIEKFYILQTKNGLGCGTTVDGEMNVKEAQRQLAAENNEIEIMPTTGLLLHNDNCHFPFTNGYESFATRISKLVLNDIYNKTFTEEIQAPMIKSVEFTSSNILVLETDAVLLKFSSTDQTTMLAKLKGDFSLKNANYVGITAVALSGNKISFTLSGNPGPSANISFLGLNSNIGYTVTNSSNIELISFKNYPINNSIAVPPNNNGETIIVKPEIITISNGKKINIKAGASINMRGLILNPSANFILEENVISKSTVAEGNGTNVSMTRVYKMTNPTPDFKGKVVYKYENADMGAIAHNNAVLEVKNETDSWSNYPDTDGVNNSVTHTFISPIRIKSITASSSGASLKVYPLKREMDILIFPNPVNSVLNIQYDGDLQIRISDISGKEIIHTEQKNIDMSSIPKGVYIVNLTDIKNAKKNSYKVIKK